MTTTGISLAGKVAIVTGAGYGIGRGIAVGLAQQGAFVVVNYGHLRSAALEAVLEIKSLGGDAIAVRADVSRQADVDRMLARVLGLRGAVDILVNNAGVIGRTPLLELDEHEWDRVMGVNLRGAYLCSRAVARAMVRTGTHGRIVHIGSIHAVRSMPGRCHYAASKAGLVAMNRVMAFELAPHGILCNVIAPGATESEAWGTVLADAAEVQRVAAEIPLGRIGTPNDVAAAVLFLVSPAADYITGTSIDVDGGLLATPIPV